MSSLLSANPDPNKQNINQIPTALLLPDSVNYSANTTYDLKAYSIRANVITDNIATLSGGYLSNVNEPLLDIDVATKHYVDNLSRQGPGGPINYSVQVNDGLGHFTGYLALLWSSGLILSGSLNVSGSGGTVGIGSNSRITGISDPILQTDAANKRYVQGTNLKIVNKSTVGIPQTITLLPSEIINTILKRSVDTSGTLDQDILPKAADIIAAIPGAVVGSSFSFFYHYVSNQTTTFKVMILYGNTTDLTKTNILSKGNYFYINTPDNLINVYPETIIEFQGSVISVDAGLEEVSMYVVNISSLYSENTQQITNVGLRTDNFFSGTNSIYNNSYVIYPVVRKLVNTSASYTYTFSDLKSLLIVRRGLVANTTDEMLATTSFMTSASFSLGSGAFKIVIQNVDPVYNVTIGSDTTSGWSYATGSRVISPGHNGLFYIYANTASTSCTLFPYGIVPRSG